MSRPRWLRAGPQTQTLSEWLRAAFATGDDTMDDVHFNQLALPWDHIDDGRKWVIPCCELLNKVAEAIVQYDNLKGTQVALVALPVGLSEHLKLWSESHWSEAGLGYEPPNLMLLKGTQFDERFDEEYSYALSLPPASCAAVSGVFRSYRNFEPESPPEFGNTIFLVRRLTA